MAVVSGGVELKYHTKSTPQLSNLFLWEGWPGLVGRDDTLEISDIRGYGIVEQFFVLRYVNRPAKVYNDETYATARFFLDHDVAHM